MASLLKNKFITLLAMTFPFIGTVLYFVVYSNNQYAKFIYLSVKLFTLFFPILVVFILKNPTKVPEFNLKITKTTLSNGAIYGSLMFLSIFLFWLFPFYEESFKSKEAMLDKATSMGIRNNFILFAIFISFIHSLIEEYYWRWFVYSSFKNSFKLNKLSANFLCSLAFTSHHIVVISQYFEIIWSIVFSLGVFIAGFIWNYMYDKRNSLFGAWVSHIFADIAIMGIGYMIINS